MIEWGVVAAFIGPLIAAIGLSAGWFTYLGRRRDERFAAQIAAVTGKLEANQLVMAERIAQVESSLAQQARHLDKQDDALTTAMQAIARIEGRLAGPLTMTPTSP